MNYLNFIKKAIGKSTSESKLSPEQEFLIERASKGYLKNYFNRGFKPRAGIDSGYNLDDIHDFYQKDETFHAAVQTVVDGILSNGYKIVGKSNRTRKELEELFKKNRFSKLLKQAVLNGVLFGNAFFEIVKGGVKTSELHLLETSYMKVDADEHGEVLGYVMQPINGGDEVRFTPEEVSHLDFGSVQVKVWGDTDVESLYEVLYTKRYVQQHLRWLFEKNKFRDFFTVENGLTEESAEKFVDTYRKGDEDPDYPLFVEDGKSFNIKQIRTYTDLNVLLDILNHLDGKILRAVQVPPILMGVPDNSNRSNSQDQLRSFYIRIKSLQELIAEEITHELLPKLGFSTVEFQFNPADRRDEKDDVEIAERLINMGVDADVVEYFLRQSGLELPPDKKLFKEPEEGVVDAKKPDYMYPSRRRAEETNYEKFRNGDESETRDEQLVGKTADFGKYPYVME